MGLKCVVKKHMRLKLIVIGIHDIKELLRIFPCTLIIVKSKNNNRTSLKGPRQTTFCLKCFKTIFLSEKKINFISLGKVLIMRSIMAAIQ